MPTNKPLIFPLSSVQKYIWEVERANPVIQRACHLPLAIKLFGVPDLDILKNCIQETVNRHEALRTTFHKGKTGLRQVVSHNLQIALSWTDLTHLSNSDNNLDHLLALEVSKDFELSEGPLIRFALFYLDKSECILSVVAHHIISDHISLHIVIKEVAALYTSYIKDINFSLPVNYMQFSEYVEWQIKNGNNKYKRHTDYWRGRFHGVSPILNLPSKNGQQQLKQTFQGTTEIFKLSTSLVNRLRQLGKAYDVKLNTLLLSIFNVLLYRYTGNKNLIIGTTVPNRCHASTRSVGLFENVLMLRSDIDRGLSFANLLCRTDEVLKEAFHNSIPFGLLMEKLKEDAQFPQVMYSHYSSEAYSFGNIPSQQVYLPKQQVIADIALRIEETPEGLYCLWDYSTELFNQSTVVNMDRHFINLIESAVTNPVQSIASLSMLEVPEYQQLIKDWNNTKWDFPLTKCIHHLFEDQVKKTPDATAVVYKNTSLTYRELNYRSNQLANYLVKEGVGPEVWVGVCVERSPQLVVAFLAIFKAGGAYLPLDPSYPIERLNYILNDSGLKLVLTNNGLGRDFCTQKEIKVIDLEQDIQGPESLSIHDPDCSVEPDNLAYIIYTSGSTGNPKGVLIDHKGLPNILLDHIRLYNLKEGDCVLQFASVNFDASICEMGMALLSGARLCIADKEDLVPGDPLIETIRNYKVSHATLPPSVLATLSTENLTGLKVITVTGEACPDKLINEWADNKRFFNGYGPTETTIGATIAQFTADTKENSIGRPFSNYQIYILDTDLNPVPMGVAGEIYIGGIGVARGYHNRPELTAKKFIMSPFNKNESLYKTEDIGIYYPDGRIKFIGRLDNMVKIRGVRIELEEIEVCLRLHPDIKDAVVAAKDFSTSDKRLVAYVVPRENKNLHVDVIRDHLSSKLPHYMVPSMYIILNKLPLTLNGKIDRLKLPEPEIIHLELQKAYKPPRNEVESSLARIWEEVFIIKPIGIHANFFEIGGHSILATYIISKVRETFKINISITDIFNRPTIAQLSSLLNKLMLNEPTGNSIKPVSRNMFLIRKK